MNTKKILKISLVLLSLLVMFCWFAMRRYEERNLFLGVTSGMKNADFKVAIEKAGGEITGRDKDRELERVYTNKFSYLSFKGNASATFYGGRLCEISFYPDKYGEFVKKFVKSKDVYFEYGEDGVTVTVAAEDPEAGSRAGVSWKDTPRYDDFLRWLAATG